MLALFEASFYFKMAKLNNDKKEYALVAAQNIVLDNIDKTDVETVVEDFLSNQMLQATLEFLHRKIVWVSAKQAYLKNKGPQTDEDLLALELLKQDCF